MITGVSPQPTGDLTIPSALAEKTVAGIGERVFADCYGLTSVAIGDGVRDIGESAFNRCHGLTNVTMGINVANIGDSAFWDCKTLSGRLTIPNSVTNIGASAFRYCSELTGLTIGSGVADIGLQAFDCCGKLTSVTIPDGVKDIGGEAFGHCEGLTSFVVSGTVTNLGERAFVQCTSLRAVYFLGDAPAVGGNIYELTSERLTTYVPEDSTGWQAPGSSVLPAEWPAGDNGRNIACGTPVFVTVTFDANGGSLVGGPSSVVSNEGNHAFKWVYSKDRSISSGSDCGWVDEVTWTPYVEDPFAVWAAGNGLSGADATWDATPAKWGGNWANAFIYTYGYGLTNSVPLMTISFNAVGKPVITTPPEVGTWFTPTVIGTSALDNWKSPVVLERDGDNWTLPSGKSANFFRVRVTKGR